MEIKDWPCDKWPETLRQIPQPPKKMRIRGEFNNQFGSADFVRLCIVGPRKYSEYAEMSCQKIIAGLSQFPITIVSGLAYGIDSIAHTAALENNIHTIAIPGSGLADESIYPKAHFNLAHEILDSGGCLISEFDDNFTAINWAFPQRNRIMVGISDAVLIIEAYEKSGTMITARLATDYNKEVLAIPGSIFSESSIGTNKLIQDGAHVILNSNDVLSVLGFDVDKSIKEKDGIIKNRLSAIEKLIYENLSVEKNPTPEKIFELICNKISISEFNATLISLELKNIIRIIDGIVYKK